MSSGQPCLQPVPANEPWYERVHNNKTLSSTRRYVDYNDPESPLDDLDFRLNAEYNHHREWNKDLRQTVFQRESLRILNDDELRTLKLAGAKELPPYTCKEEQGRIHTNRIKGIEKPATKANVTNFRYWENPTKDSVHKTDNSICESFKCVM
ncbi:unnamed protein product [Dicrocoelium dendriticum]|nr:unnamed protein product [Dicrocoelium dendriticum]